jgi:autotransporter-associated beta strand protein
VRPLGFTRLPSEYGPAAPSSGETDFKLVFPSNPASFTSINNIGVLTISEIDLFGTGYQIGTQAAAIAVGAGGINDLHSQGSNTISIPLASAGGDILVNVSGPAATLNLSGRLEDSSGGPNGLVKNGLGTLALAGAQGNTLTGTTTVNNGVLRLNKSVFDGAIRGPVVIGNTAGSAGTVILDSNNQISNAVTVTINKGGVLNLNNNVEGLGPLALEGGSL